MNIHVTPGLEPIAVHASHCQQVVPDRFLTSLNVARAFIGRPNKFFPWVQYVYLLEGKLYASDNRCIIEIDLDDPSFGPARLSLGDVALLQAIGDNPNMANLGAKGAEFGWDDGRWCKLSGDLKGLEMAEISRKLISEFWRKGRKLSSGTREAMLKLARKRSASHIQKFTGSVTGYAEDQFWRCDSIMKVMRIADWFSPGGIPSSFTFPNGRGLIVKPSQHTIDS